MYRLKRRFPPQKLLHIFRFLAVFLICLTLSVSSVAQVAPAAASRKPQPEVQALLDQGRAAQAASPARTAEALRLLNQALEKARALQDKMGEAFALYQIGEAYRNTGEPGKALPFYQQALPLQRQAADKGNVAWTLYNIAGSYLEANQRQKALEFYQQALALFRQAGDSGGVMGSLFNLGAVYRGLRQSQKALALYQQTLALYRQAGDKGNEAFTLNNIGTFYNDDGQPHKSLEAHRQALALYRQVSDRRGVIGALDGIAQFNFVTGQAQKAVGFYQQTVPLYQQLGDTAGEAVALNNIGSVYKKTGQPQKALGMFQEVLTLRKRLGDKGGEADSLLNIGVIYSDVGQPQKALVSYQQALAQFSLGSDTRDKAVALANIGSVYFGMDQPQKALGFYQRALPLYRQAGDRAGEAKVLGRIAVVEEKRGRLAEAEHYLKNAITLLESIRDELGGLSEAKVSFLASTLGTYHGYIRLLLKMNRPADAFAVTQKTKARALLDLMASGKVDVHNQMTAEETQQEQELRGRADLLNAQMVQEGVQNEIGAKKRFAALQVDLAHTESDLQEFNDGLYARHPDLARKRAAATATLADTARLLPPDTALLEYVVLSTNIGTKRPVDQTELFVVTAEAGNAVVRTYTLPIKGDALAKQAFALRAACADPRKTYKVLAQEMQRLLLPPSAVRQLAGKKRLIICPDGPLWDVPFAALQDTKGRFLLERYELVYAYSATGAQATLLAGAKKNPRRKQAAGTLLALANPDFGGEKRFSDGNRFGHTPAVLGQRPIDAPSRPIDAPSRPIDAPSRPIDAPSRPINAPSRELLVPRGGSIVALPGTQREADMLRKRIPGASVFTGAAAQEARLKKDASGYRYLHLASHAFFNDAAPLLSSVVLARPTSGSGEDGFLTAREIFGLNLSGTSMVVLSACN